MSCRKRIRGKTTLGLIEWAGYVSFLKDDFSAYAKKQGMDVEIVVLKPDITDENQLFHTIRASRFADMPVDICTPSSSFYKSREARLLKLLAPLEPVNAPNYAKIPKAFRTSSLFHDDAGKPYGLAFLAGSYGLAYNADLVKEAPKSWSVLWAEDVKGKYSVNGETAFVNAYVSLWLDQPADPTIVYDIDRIDHQKLQQRFNALAAGAKHLWTGFGNTVEQLAGLHYTATWGFGIVQANKAGQHWKLASPREGTSIWVDALSLTAQAAKNREKVRAFYLFADFLTSRDTQIRLMNALGAFPLNADVKDILTEEQIKDYHIGDENYFDERFFWHPINDRTANSFNKMWEDAKSRIQQ